METAPDFATMNETDVREHIVRPLLERLGYRHGTNANIRTELRLTYSHTFLGRKNPKKDPPLAGRADYICDAISFGRWVVEVKAPGEELTQSAIQQAHTYASHPEVSAAFFLVTNGRDFKLYETGKLAEPILKWSFNDANAVWDRLFNIVSPQAIQKRARLTLDDPGKPLGKCLASKLRIIGGEIIYEYHESNHPLLKNDYITGLRLPVTGGSVQRSEAGLIIGHVYFASVAPLSQELNEALGIADGFDFSSVTEYLSEDPEHPNIFQNHSQKLTPAGTLITVPGLGKLPVPFEIASSALTEAVGFVENDKFQGTFQISYEFRLGEMPPKIRVEMEGKMGRIPATGQSEGSGRFEIDLLANI
jgi:hypothetical protein